MGGSLGAVRPIGRPVQHPWWFGAAQVSSVVVDEGDASIESKEHPFTKHLPGEWKMMGVKMGDIKMKDASAGGDDDAVKAFEPKLYRLKEGGGASKVLHPISTRYPPDIHTNDHLISTRYPPE